MEIQGKVIQVLPIESGATWSKQSYILETSDKFPKKIAFTAWKDKIDEFNIQQGQQIEVSINVESREYNSRWYTDVTAWKVNVLNQSSTPTAPVTPHEEVSDDDLPF